MDEESQPEQKQQKEEAPPIVEEQQKPKTETVQVDVTSLISLTTVFQQTFVEFQANGYLPVAVIGWKPSSPLAINQKPASAIRVFTKALTKQQLATCLRHLAQTVAGG